MFIGNCVKSFGEVEKKGVCLLMVVRGRSPIMDCFYKLGFTGEPCLESMLAMEDNIISSEVFPQVVQNDMLHDLALYTC